MILEALSQFDLKVSGVVKTLNPGDRLDLPEEKAEKLRRLAGGKVRVITEGVELQPGMWVQFYSPLFGDVTAQVVSFEVGQVWIGQHSVLRQSELVRIPLAWVQGVYRNEQPAPRLGTREI